MRPSSQERLLLDGPAGAIEVVVNDPRSARGDTARRGIALIAHPHPLFGGTLDNKVVQTLTKAFFAQGYVVARMNFRGVGATEGTYNEGVGETEDMLLLAAQMRQRVGLSPLLLAGFSFGAFVQARASRIMTGRGEAVERLVLVAPAVGRFDVGEVAQGTLVIHGEHDDVVPLADVLSWARPQQLPIIVMPGAGHFFHGNLVELQSVIQRSCPCPRQS